jgi:hypothetical protein
MLVALLLTVASPGIALEPSADRHVRLVADERVEENRRSIFVPVVFLAIGAGGTLTGAVFLYAGAVSALSGAGAGTVGAGATAFGLALLTVGGVIVIVAVVFAVVGAIKLVRAIRGGGASEPDRTYEVQTVQREKGDRLLFGPDPLSKTSLSPFVVARF